MIVVTGFGRSGTSALASLYREMGHDPGGHWNPAVNAGLEDASVARLNDLLLQRMSLRVPEMAEILGRTAELRRAIPAGARTRVRRALRHLLAASPLHRPSLAFRWDMVEPLAREYAMEIAQVSADRTVVKDPRFLWTLPIWLAAGSTIEHVVISLRELSQVVASRRRAQQLELFTDEQLVNTLTASLGVAVTGLVERRVPFSIVRYPDFLTESPGVLCGRLGLPESYLPLLTTALDRVRRLS